MITNIYIKNIAVIEELDFELEKGFNVLTGETGAGKSIIIDSINLILGLRATKELIRYGEKKAMVQLSVFTQNTAITEKLSEGGILVEDDTVIFSREITDEGRSTCRINSQIVTVSLLREIATMLINIHGQHDSQSLLNPNEHINFLDNFADKSILACMVDYKNLNGLRKDILRRIEKLSTNELERGQRIDLLKYQINEIEKARLEIGEDDVLKQRRDVISNMGKISESVHNSYACLYGDENTNSAYDAISIAVNDLSVAKNFDESLVDLHSRLYDLMYNLEDITEVLGDYKNSLEYDEQELNEIEERLNTLSNLKRKYSPKIEGILEFCEKAKQELDTLENSEENANGLKKELEQTTEKLSIVAGKISEIRKATATRLQEQIKNQLIDLDMKNAQFFVDIVSNKDEFLSNGIDKVEFLFTANAGQPPRQLAKIASGGELSRIMLAIKAVLVDTDLVELMIFDEIDTGVSGSAAQKIGKKLASISKSKQVLCITHLPQIAAMADVHYLIGKISDETSTKTQLSVLDYENRKIQLSAMISADKNTQASLKNASELLENAKLLKEEVRK